MHKDETKVSLLEKYGYTEQMAKEKCEEYGLLSPCYKSSKRGGCWFCPNSKFAEHRKIRELDKETWDRFVALEKEKNLANPKWNVYGDTLEIREQKLATNSRQLTLFEYDL